MTNKKRKWKVFYDLHAHGTGATTSVVEAESEHDAVAVFRRSADRRAIVKNVKPA